MSNEAVESLKASVAIDVDRSRITVGGLEFAYHCDKFNTRIIKGLEDVLGADKALDLIAGSAAKTFVETNSMFSKAIPGWDGLDVAGKLEVIMETWKVFGFGSVTCDKMDGSSTKATTSTSYLAEGYLENMERWNWPTRKAPFCHDLTGYLRAAFALATAKDLSAIKVIETKCRTKGDDVCAFEVEVN